MEHHLSLGGHLLSWVFPVALVLFVGLRALWEARRGGGAE